MSEFESHFQELATVGGSWGTSINEASTHWTGAAPLPNRSIFKNDLPLGRAYVLDENDEITGTRVEIMNQLGSKTIVGYQHFALGFHQRFVDRNELKAWRKQSQRFQVETATTMAEYLDIRDLKATIFSPFGSLLWGPINTGLTPNIPVSDIDQLVHLRTDGYKRLQEHFAKAGTSDPLIAKLTSIVERQIALFDPQPVGLDIFIAEKYQATPTTIRTNAVSRLSFRKA